jgi:hypothetical protein
MSVKILFFPLSIIIAFALSVFYIQPEFDSMMIKRIALQDKQTLAESMGQKIQNMHSLESNLNANKDSETAVLRYLPNTRDDERIVDGINFLAMQSGLLPISIKIDKAKEVEVVAETPATDQKNPFAADSTNGVDAGLISNAPALIITPKILEVSLTAIGSYESIRDTVGKIAHSDRFQNFTLVGVNRSVATAQLAEKQDNTTLNASLKMSFLYFPKAKAAGNYNHTALNQKSFDFGIAQKLKQYTSSPIPSIEVGAAGIANPFLR